MFLYFIIAFIFGCMSFLIGLSSFGVRLFLGINLNKMYNYKGNWNCADDRDKVPINVYYED